MPKQQTPRDQMLIALLGKSDLSGYIVTRHGYRQQRVVGDHVTDGPFEYTSDDPFDQLQQRLAEAVGERPGNHETYVVRSRRDPGVKLYIWFSDWTVVVGKGMRPY